MHSWALANRKCCVITVFELVYACCRKPTVKRVGMQCNARFSKGANMLLCGQHLFTCTSMHICAFQQGLIFLSSDIVNFYCTCVRPLLEYCAPVFPHAIPSYLSEDLERIQKRALNVISPGHSYWDNLTLFGLKTLQSRRKTLCLKFFQSILSDERFSNLVPPKT